MSFIKNKKGSAALGSLLSIIIVIALAAGAYFLFIYQPQVSLDGLKGPTKKQVKTGSASMDITGYEVNLTYKYEYTLDGIVVGTKNYTQSGMQNQIASKDVVIAWGSVAAKNKESKFKWTLADRDYSFTPNAEFDTITVSKNSSITHLISSDTTTQSQIKKIKAGQHVILKGYLVDVTAEPSIGDIVYWNTSTVTTDTGADAGEILYVTSVETVEITE